MTLVVELLVTHVIIAAEEEAKLIFAELPELERLYASVVPSMMNVKQFWDRAARSRYFLEAAGKEVPANRSVDNLFDLLPPPAPRVLPPPVAAVAATADIGADLTGELQKDEPPSKRRKGLIDRLNERSTAVLVASLQEKKKVPPGDATESGGSSSSTAVPVPVDLRASVLRRQQALKRIIDGLKEDMASEPTKGPQVPKLRLDDAAVKCDPGDAMASEALEGAPKRLDKLRSWSQRALKDPHKPLDLQQGTWCVVERDQAELRSEHKGKNVAKAAAAAASAGEPAGLGNKIVTLLKHFWSSRWSQVELRERLLKEAKNLRLGASSRTEETARRALTSFAPALERLETALQLPSKEVRSDSLDEDKRSRSKVIFNVKGIGARAQRPAAQS